MNTHLHTALLIVGAVFAIAFAAMPLLDRRYAWARWGKVAAVIAGLAGVAWSTLGLILYDSHIAVSHHLFDGLRYTKGLCGGVCLGVVVAVLLARPYRKAEKGSIGQPGEI